MRTCMPCTDRLYSAAAAAAAAGLHGCCCISKRLLSTYMPPMLLCGIVTFSFRAEMHCCVIALCPA